MHHLRWQDQPTSPRSPGRSVNVAHSPLLERVATQPSDAASTQTRAEVTEARRKFVHTLDDQVLDWKHHHPTLIEKCLETLATVFGNLVDHPQEEKIRRIRANTNAFKNNIAGLRGGELLLSIVGWRTQIIDNEKYWVYEAPPDSVHFQVLKETIPLLGKALSTAHDKTGRTVREKEQRLAKQKEEKERILLNIEDDKKLRSLTQSQ